MDTLIDYLVFERKRSKTVFVSIDHLIMYIYSISAKA